MQAPAETYQQGFHRRWGHLRRARVRALAWLLDAPDLLDAADPLWAGRIAATGPVTSDLAAWLGALDHDPVALDAALGPRPYTRLGLYAEKLMAFYYQQHGRLVAHGLQVRANRNDTVGEFDFLLEHGAQALEHIEFATKFYLLDPDGGQQHDGRLDTLVGPNLADSLGLKMRKIFERQLSLGTHPAAQAVLPRPVTLARALVKGWLFYPHGNWPAMRGIAAGHCRGFWCALEQLDTLGGAEDYMILPKLQWLAPLRATAAEPLLSRAALHAEIAAQFETNPAPVLVAAVRKLPGWVEETERGFIVPNDWCARAAARRRLKPAG